MTFTPVVPLPGYAGWQFLNRTIEQQTARLAMAPTEARDMQYFRERIGTVTSARDLVSDYRLLRVALNAYGLQDDLPNRAFIERVLADGPFDPDALSNRLADKRYRSFSEAFGFGSDLPPRTQLPGFADRVLSRFTRETFEQRVGLQDPNLRLALSAERTLAELTERNLSDTGNWLTILGNPPLRQVFETAFGLPVGIGGLDLDRQIDEFKARSRQVLGFSDVTRFANPVDFDSLIRNFTARAQAAEGPSPFTRGAVALSLLRGVA